MAIICCPDINQPVNRDQYRGREKFRCHLWSLKGSQRRLKSFGCIKNYEAEDHRPYSAVRNDLEGIGWFKQRPVQREHSPKHICANPVDEAESLFIQLTEIHELNCKIPFTVFNHRHRCLEIIAALTCHAKFVTLDLRFN